MRIHTNKYTHIYVRYTSNIYKYIHTCIYLYIHAHTCTHTNGREKRLREGVRVCTGGTRVHAVYPACPPPKNNTI